MGLAQQVAQIFNVQIQGVGMVVAVYPTAAAGTALKGSGSTTGAMKFAAAGANVKQVVAKATLTPQWRLSSWGIDTMSALDIINVRLGAGAAGGAAMTQVLWEQKAHQITLAGTEPYSSIPWGATATIVSNGTTDGVLADLANASAADITANIHLGIATGFGS
jgi:hypothetical protein